MRQIVDNVLAVRDIFEARNKALDASAEEVARSEADFVESPATPAEATTSEPEPAAVEPSVVKPAVATEADLECLSGGGEDEAAMALQFAAKFAAEAETAEASPAAGVSAEASATEEGGVVAAAALDAAAEADEAVVTLEEVEQQADASSSVAACDEAAPAPVLEPGVAPESPSLARAAAAAAHAHAAAMQAHQEATQRWALEQRAQLAEKGGRTVGAVEALRGSVTNLRGATQAALISCAGDVAGMCGKLLVAAKRHVAQAKDMEAALRKETLKRKACFNELQELKGNIRVFVRVRPASSKKGAAEAAVVCRATKDGDLEVDGDEGEQHGGPSVSRSGQAVPGAKATRPSRLYEFDHVFGSGSTQEAVFAEAKPLATSVMDGYHASIIAYGQTGSGKTYTMDGTPSAPGVNGRALAELFRIKAEKEDGGLETVEITLTMVEIYNETVKDLLAGSGEAGDACATAASKPCEIRQRPESEGGGVYLPTASVVAVGCAEDLEAAVCLGRANRSVGSTKANEHSSRSHSVVMVDVRVVSVTTGLETRGRLSLVDLAGSERIAKTGASGATLKEAQAINKSLSALGNVISALRAKQDDGKGKGAHVPFRDSKLTFLLQDSLGADNKTLMIVQVSPEQCDAKETVCSLAFGLRARNVELGGSSGGGKGSGAGANGGALLAKAQAEAKEATAKVKVLAAKLAEEEKQTGELRVKAEKRKAKAEAAEAEVATLKAKLDACARDLAKERRGHTASAKDGASSLADAVGKARAQAKAEAAAEVAAVKLEMEALKQSFQQRLADHTNAAKATAEGAHATAGMCAKPAVTSAPTVAPVVVAAVVPGLSFASVAASPPKQPASPRAAETAVAPAAKAKTPTKAKSQTPKKAKTPTAKAEAPTVADENALPVGKSPAAKKGRKVMFKSPSLASPTPLSPRLTNINTEDGGDDDHFDNGCGGFAGDAACGVACGVAAPGDGAGTAAEGNAGGRAGSTPRKAKRPLGPLASMGAAKSRLSTSTTSFGSTSSTSLGGSGGGEGGAKPLGGFSRVTVAEQKKQGLRNGPMRVMGGATAASNGSLASQRRASLSRWH